MSAEKMILIRSLGYLVPQSAIRSAAICSKVETTYDMPQTELAANPRVIQKEVKSYLLYLELETRALPKFDAEEEDEAVEAAPKRRGPKPKAAAKPETPESKTFLLWLHEDTISEQETTLSASTALQTFIQDEDGLAEVRKNMTRLASFMQTYNSSVESIAPAMPQLSDMLPDNVAADIGRVTQSGIDVHADQMRAQSEDARAKYDKVINWFRRKVLVGESSSVDALNIGTIYPNAAERDAAETPATSLTQKTLIDLVKAEMLVVL